MKTNYNLPKITATLIPSGYIHSDKDDVLFPRGDHPDNRTAKQFFEDMDRKNFKRKFVDKVIGEARIKYPNRKPVICLTTGDVFEGINLAEAHFGIARGNLGKHLKGDDQYRHVKGLRFKFI